MKSIMKFITHIFTEPDNSTICPVRVLGILYALQLLAAAFDQSIIQHQKLPYQEFGASVGMMLAALGIALGIKKDTQPKEDK